MPSDETSPRASCHIQLWHLCKISHLSVCLCVPQCFAASDGSPPWQSLVRSAGPCSWCLYSNACCCLLFVCWVKLKLQTSACSFHMKHTDLWKSSTASSIQVKSTWSRSDKCGHVLLKLCLFHRCKRTQRAQGQTLCSVYPQMLASLNQHSFFLFKSTNCWPASVCY